jgi:hypothetical protein
MAAKTWTAGQVPAAFDSAKVSFWELGVGTWELTRRSRRYQPRTGFARLTYPETMTFLKKLFASKSPAQRVRVCVECGMPIAEHKDWCSIFRTQQEMAAKATAK